jgi:hypothetical protein
VSKTQKYIFIELNLNEVFLGSSPSLAGHPWLLAGSVFVSLMLVKKME